MQNIEYKSELRDIGLARGVCEHRGATRVGAFRQVDIYYKVSDGRLKRRETGSAEGRRVEYIFYHRADRLRPTLSHFTIYDERAALERWGERGLVEWLTVRKTREVWLYKNVRIHLDDVEGLGRFFELEAQVGPGCHVGECHHRVNEVRGWFEGGILGEPISVGYSDLFEKEIEGKRAEGT